MVTFRRVVMLCVAIGVATTGVAEDSSIRVDDGVVLAEVKGKTKTIGRLAENDDPFFGFDYTYSLSPDGEAIAFIGKEGDGVGLFYYRIGETTAGYLPAFGEITGRTWPEWSPDSTMVTYSAGNRIWVFDIKQRDGWVVTRPQEEFYEDIDPVFSDDGWSIYFYRGTTFEYIFSGDLYLIGIDGTGLARIEEEFPRYPEEDLSGDEYEDPYMITIGILMETRVQQFITDLENHDYERILSYFPGWYIVTQMEIFDRIGEPIDLETFNSFFFNGALMYENYENVIYSLESVVRVVGYEIYLFDMEIFMSVELDDGRTVDFYLMFDPDTLQFSGPFG